MVKESDSTLVVPTSTEISSPAKTRVEDRWRKSFFAFGMLDGKPCTWRQHTALSLQIIYGYSVALAKRDPEGFVWASWQAFQRNAAKLGKKIGRSQIFASLAFAEANGMISGRVVKERWGRDRTGFLVYEHDQWTTQFPNAELCAVNRYYEIGAKAENRAIEYRRMSAERQKKTVANNRQLIGTSGL
jgi:hypothetical protein